MLKFSCDYMEGAHPEILSRLSSINFDKNDGYGLDEYCESARENLRKLCCNDHAEVHFLVGGTQTNTVVLDSILRFNEGVLAASTGHINVHEAGAIEATGHKVIPLKASNGKVDIAAMERHLHLLKTECDVVGWEHYVAPRVLYISFPTEYGSLYTLAELKQLRSICDEYGLYLYADGARLGYGLASPGCDVTLPELARLCDVFYLGGTKVGALFGEAVVVSNPELTIPRGLIKQRGAMLAKGWLLGVQFDTLLASTTGRFEDTLYYRIARNAVDRALHLRAEMVAKGYEKYIDSPTNQQFFIADNAILPELSQKVAFDSFSAYDETHTVIRFCTSWATTAAQIDALLSLL